MASTQDASVGIGLESTFKTGVAPTRWYEYVDESLDWNKNIKQGQGLRVGGRVARSARRVVPSADGGGDVTIEATSKGMGLLWQALLGTGVATLVSGTTYQHNFTIGDAPSSLTIQKGLVEAGGTVDAYSFLGCTCASWELDFPNADIVSLKSTWDAADITTAQAYTAPSYAAAPVNLFHFANGSIATGTLTAPTTTALASGSGTIADVRGGSVSFNTNLRNDRFNVGGAGRKSKQLPGLRQISGKLDVEYDNTTFRDAVINDTPMNIILNWTGGALSTGVEQLQVVLPEVKFDSEIAKTNGADLIVQSMSFQVLDNLTAAQPIWVIMRTADAAL